MEQPKSPEFAIFHPRSIFEAWGFATQVENYGFRDALKMKPLCIPLARISECGQLKIRKGVLYYIQYHLQYENTLLSRTAPAHASLTFAEVADPGPVRLLYRLHGGPQYVKKFYLHSVSATLLLILIASTSLFVFFKNWLVGQVLQDHWFMAGQCDLACAKKVALIHVTFWMVTFSVCLPLVWPAIFYRLTRARIKSYHMLFTLRIEATLLMVTGLMLLGTYLSFNPIGKYWAFVEKQKSGALGSRIPAGND